MPNQGGIERIEKRSATTYGAGRGYLLRLLLLFLFDFEPLTQKAEEPSVYGRLPPLAVTGCVGNR
jgi:hypothetical protein